MTAPMDSELLLTRVNVAGPEQVDVRIRGDRIAEVAPGLRPGPAARVIDAAGGALLPGLHDNHCHLLSLAARFASVDCGPPAVTDRAALLTRLRRAAADATGWVRAVRYDETVTGRVDRHVLDAAVPSVPVRLQHRSGHAWILNSAALDRLRLPAGHPGVERAHDGEPTGWLFDLDDLIREQAPSADPDLRGVGREYAALGVTGVTDATPSSPGALDLLARAVRTGDLPLRVTAMTAEDPPPPQPLITGPVKFLLSESDLPPVGELARAIARAHACGRRAAVHAASRETLMLALSAFEDAGTVHGDRIEHASLAPDETLAWMRDLAVSVVTQPNFIAESGDRYLRELPADDIRVAYRCRALLDAGIPVTAGTDAPIGGHDPWSAIRAAVRRETALGQVIGHDERITPDEAVRLFTSSPEEPGRRAGDTGPGDLADLCVLRVPWREALADPRAEHVLATIVGGEVSYLAQGAG